MATNEASRKSKLASKFSSYTGKKVGSGSAKLATQYKGVGTSTTKKQTEAERQASTLITSTGERLAGINRTQQALSSLQKQGSVLSGSTAFSRTSGMLAAVSSGNKLTQAQQQAAIQDLVSTSSTNNPNATKRELENTRAILGTGYQSPSTLSVFQSQAAIQSMKKALEQDLYYRNQRIENRNKLLKEQERSLTGAEMKLAQFDKYIDGNEFSGTQSQYNQYQKAYNDYVKKYNTYSSNVQIQNEDIKTYNKNAQNVESKKSFKTVRAAVKIANAKYTATQKKITEKISPSIETYEKFVKAQPEYKLIANFPNKTVANTAKKIYEAEFGVTDFIKEKPLAASVTFATFFVGGVALKGLGTAAKAIGAGARTAKAAKAIESLALRIYITSTGFKLAESKNARQFGYRTGEVIFAELIPAGLGLKAGVKVVESIPKGAKLLKVAGRRATGKAYTSLESGAEITISKTKTAKIVDRFIPKSVKQQLSITKAKITRYTNSGKINKQQSAIFNERLARLKLEYDKKMFGSREYKQKVIDVYKEIEVTAAGKTFNVSVMTKNTVEVPRKKVVDQLTDFYTKKDIASIRGSRGTYDVFEIKASQRNANLKAYKYATNAEAKPPSYYIKQEISRISDILNGRNIKLITMDVDAYGNITYKITTSKSLITRKEEALKVIQQMNAVQKLQSQLISLNKQHLAFKKGIKNLLPQDLNYRKMVKNEWGEVEIYEVKSKSIKTKLKEYNAKIREVKTKIRDIKQKLDIKQKALKESIKKDYASTLTDPLLKPVKKELNILVERISAIFPQGKSYVSKQSGAKITKGKKLTWTEARIAKRKGELQREARKIQQTMEEYQRDLAKYDTEIKRKKKILEFKKKIRELTKQTAEFERLEKIERAEYEKQISSTIDDISDILKVSEKPSPAKKVSLASDKVSVSEGGKVTTATLKKIIVKEQTTTSSTKSVYSDLKTLANDNKLIDIRTQYARNKLLSKVNNRISSLNKTMKNRQLTSAEKSEYTRITRTQRILNKFKSDSRYSDALGRVLKQKRAFDTAGKKTDVFDALEVESRISVDVSKSRTITEIRSDIKDLTRLVGNERIMTSTRRNKLLSDAISNRQRAQAKLKNLKSSNPQYSKIASEYRKWLRVEKIMRMMVSDSRYTKEITGVLREARKGRVETPSSKTVAELEKSIKDIGYRKPPAKKKVVSKAKKLDAERDAKLKSGDYIEVKQSNGQVVLQKVEAKVSPQAQARADAESRKIKSASDASKNGKTAVKVNNRVIPLAQVTYTMSLALLRSYGNKFKPVTIQSLKQKAGVRHTQRPAQTQKPSTKQLQSIAAIQKQAEKTTQAQKQKQRQRQSLSVKAEEMPIPVIPKTVTTKSKKKPRKVVKPITAKDTSTNINKIGRLLGGFK